MTAHPLPEIVGRLEKEHPGTSREAGLRVSRRGGTLSSVPPRRLFSFVVVQDGATNKMKWKKWIRPGGSNRGDGPILHFEGSAAKRVPDKEFLDDVFFKMDPCHVGERYVGQQRTTYVEKTGASRLDPSRIGHWTKFSFIS